MNLLDVILLAPVVYGLLRGIFRGLVEELTAILALVIALISAKLFAPKAAVWLLQSTGWDASICEVCAYLIVFFAVALVATLLGKLITRLLKAISLGWLNRLLGAVFGALKWALIVSVLLNGVILLDNYFHFIKPETKESSIAFSTMQKLASVAWDEVQELQLPDTTSIIKE